MKKVIKKLASLLMVTVFVITGTTFQMLAGALSESVINGKQKLYISYYPYSYNFSGSGLGTSIYGQFVKINVGSANGEYAYCMDAEADSGITGTSIFTAEDFNLSDWVKRNYTSNQIKLMKYAAIYTIKNASETKYGYSNEVENIASQIINWTILHNWFNTSSESSVLNVYTANMSSSVASNVKACYNKIKEQILSHKTIPSFAVGKGQTPTPKKMTTNADGTFSITLTDNKNCSSYFDWAKALNNSKYKNYLSITTNSAGKLVIKSTKPIPKSDEFELTAKKTKSKYQNELDTASPVALIVDESQLSGQNAVGYTNTDNDPVTASISLYTDTIGTAQIKKVWQHNNDTSSTKADNSDIYFTIKNSSGTAVKATGSAGSYTYSASGSVSQFKLNSSNTFLVKSLPAGTYTVTEHGKNSDGSIPYYTRTGGVSKTVTVTAGSTGTVTFTNTRNTGTGEVIKTWIDTNGNAISANSSTAKNQQIYFRIKNADGKYITVSGTKYSGTYSFTGTTTTATSLYVNPGTGTFTVSDLPTGKYTVYEYGSPDGYSVNRASQTITISRDKTSSVSFINSEDSGTAQIKKVWLSDTTLSASEIANLEKNVYFTVKDANGKYIKVTGSAGAYVYAGTQTSANNMKLSSSKFNVSKLPMGTYTVTEINNASGYNPKTQTKTVTIANKGEIKAISFTNKSTPVVVIRKHFSDEDNLTAAQLKAQYAKVTVNLQVLGFSGSVSSNPPAGYYVQFTGSNGNYTYKGLSSTKTSATNLKLNDNGEMIISFGTNTAPYYLAVIESYSGTEYDIDNRDQRIDLGDGDPNAVIDLDDIELNNQLKTGTVQVDKEFLNENGAVENITDEQLAKVSFKIMHNGKYLTFTGADGNYTYKGENNSGTELKLNKATYNFVANKLPAREEYTVYEVSGTTGYSFSIDPVTFEVTPNGTVKKVFTNKAMTGTISIVKHSADGVLSGWQFRVTGTAKTGQSYDKTFTTDAKGTITISNIRIGDYKVTEVKTGKTVGYITENSKDLEVKTDTVTTVNIENKPYANIVINKVDAKTGEKVSGATFGIYTDAECEIPAQAYTSATDGTLTDAVITESATGKYTCNFLPIESKDGTKYYIKELTAPEGYYLDTNAHAVTLKTANATVSVTNEIGKSDFNEYPYGHGAVIKEWNLDNGTANMTADEIAQMKSELEKSLYFTVKDSNGKYITATGADGIYTYSGEGTSEFRYTLKNSTFTIAELPTGDYTVTEFSTLSDYTIKSENPVKITVVRNQTAKATFVNERDTGTGKVIKVWKQFDTMTAAEQAEIEKNVYFTVTDSNGAYLKVKESNGSYIYCGTQKTETKFALKNGAFVIAELPTGDYTVTEFSTLSDYTIKSENPVKITVVRNQTAKATFVNERDTGTGKVIKVWKQFDTMTAAEQAEIEKNVYFTVTDSNGAYLKVKESNGSYIYCGTQKTETKFALKNGAFVIAELPTGEYTVTEYDNAKDYSPKQQTQKIKITKNTVAVLTFTNIRDTGNASIVKKWTNPNGLTTAQKAELEKNVYFTVKNADGAYLTAVSKNGKYVYNGSQTAEARFMLTNSKFEIVELPTGTYTITEYNNAVGYLPLTQSRTITVTKGKTATAAFVNEVILGNVTLTKVDEDYPDNKLSGAEFTIYAEDKKTEIGKMTEVEKGIYRYESLRYGKYYLKETKAPDYFIQDVNFYYFEITENGKTVIVTNDELGKGTFINAPQKGEIKIVKTSYDNKVEGFSFEVTGKTFTGQTFSKIYTTDKDGIIRINDLRAGEYNIHEVNDSASAGYLLPDDKQLTIDRDGAMIVAEMHNGNNPPSGVRNDGLQTVLIIISAVALSASAILISPRKQKQHKH